MRLSRIVYVYSYTINIGLAYASFVLLDFLCHRAIWNLNYRAKSLSFGSVNGMSTETRPIAQRWTWVNFSQPEPDPPETLDSAIQSNPLGPALTHLKLPALYSTTNNITWKSLSYSPLATKQLHLLITGLLRQFLPQKIWPYQTHELNQPMSTSDSLFCGALFDSSYLFVITYCQRR